MKVIKEEDQPYEFDIVWDELETDTKSEKDPLKETKKGAQKAPKKKSKKKAKAKVKAKAAGALQSVKDAGTAVKNKVSSVIEKSRGRQKEAEAKRAKEAGQQKKEADAFKAKVKSKEK